MSNLLEQAAAAGIQISPEEMIKKIISFQQDIQSVLNKHSLPFPIVIGTLQCHLRVFESMMVQNTFAHMQQMEQQMELAKKEGKEKMQ